MKKYFQLLFLILIVFFVCNTSAMSSPLDDEKINLPKVIYYLQVLSGIHPGEIPPKPHEEPTIAIIGTGGISGVYYPTGGALAKILNRAETPELENVRFTVESTPGSAFNVNAIMEGKLKLGIVQSDVQHKAFFGEGDWEEVGPQKGLRSIFSIHAESVNLVAADDAGIESVLDLKGKIVHIGHEGSGQRQSSIDVLQAFGIDYENDLTIADGPTSEAPEMLQNNEIDAFFFTVGHPSQTLVDATMGDRKVHFVSILGEEIQKLIEEKSFYAMSMIPLDKYPGVSNLNDVETIGVKATLVTNEDAPDEVIYELTRIIFDNLEEFIGMHPAYENLTPENMLEGLSAPIHEGALHFYREMKLIDDTKNIIIGTGSVTGVYYPTGGAISKMINDEIDHYGIQCSVESTDGSVFNVNNVLNGNLDFGIVQSDRQFQAIEGLAEWEEDGPQERLRSVFSIHSESVTLIATEESGIKSIFDLAGKRVNIGNPGSGPRQNSIDVLNAAELDVENGIQIFEEKIDKAIEMLHNDEIDALFYTVGHPSTAISNAVQGTKKVRIIPLSFPGLEKIFETRPYYVKSVIPADIYPGILNTEDIETFGVKATFVTSEEMPEKIVYAITKEVFEKFEKFKEMHPAYKVLCIEDMLEGLSAPIHPGAMHYFKESGLIKYHDIIIGTGSITGVYYPTGGAIAKIVNRNSDAHRARLSVVSTAGSVFNVNAVLEGGLDFGIVQSDRQFQAFNGLAEWEEKGPQRRLRAVFSIHNESVTLIAAEDANISSVMDLKGKNVNIGNEGSGQLQNSIDTLNACGIDHENDINAFYEKASDASKMLQEGEIDAFFFTVGHPSQAISQAFYGERPVKIIPIDGEGIDELVDEIPYYAKSLIPGGLYPGVEEDVETFGVKATFVTHDEMPDEVVFSICAEIFDNIEAFRSLHPAYQTLTPENMLEGLSAPIHPGALAFYQEREMTNFQMMEIGTGSTAGVYYPTGGAIAQMVNQNTDHNIYMISRSTPGSVFNINAVLYGEMPFGIAQSDRQYQAVNGESEWEEDGAQDRLRAVFSIHPESIALIATDESGIKSMQDLKGKRVNLGNHGSGQLQNSMDAINAFNINEDDIITFYEDARHGAEMLIKGKIDAFFYTVGHPSSFICEILMNEERPVHLVPITGPAINLLISEKPYYAEAIIPKEIYPGAQLEADIPTFGVKATFVTSVDMPEDIVYDITRSIFENFAEFKELHPAYQVLTVPDMLEGNSAPFHSGAVKYYKEKGLQ